jgi:2-succinyl-6-hydroxy-2,4-cyclohexadiene-1-carboxylate synthase
MMKIESNGVEYHVEIIGDGVPLLLLHGFTGSWRTWKSLIPSLGEKYKLIIVDIIGHGNTDVPADYMRYSMEKVTEDLKNILNKLCIEKASVLGYSMGGRLALSFACLYPHYIKCLILESASPGLKSLEERRLRKEQDNRLADQIVTEGIGNFVEYWENIQLFSSQKDLPTNIQTIVREERISNSVLGLANSLRGMGTGSQPSWWAELQTLDFPVLLITGDLDRKFYQIAAKMQKLIKNCEWKIIKNTGHAIHVEDVEKFDKIVSEFLSKQ